eukprot:m.43733 g.43733  ORF g.43733 m.43733 type:complete len:591 (-) comp8464_c0_seq1:112-1884(-)
MAQVTFGAAVKLQHCETGKLLHSRPVALPPGSSGLQQVACTAGGSDPQGEWWTFKPKFGYTDAALDGRGVNGGEIVRLEHAATHVNLHSHAVPLFCRPDHHEVCGFGKDEAGDPQDDWRVEVVGPLLSGAPFRLVHMATNVALHSQGCDFPVGGQEVSGFHGRDNNDFWRVVEVRGVAAVTAQVGGMAIGVPPPQPAAPGGIYPPPAAAAGIYPPPGGCFPGVVPGAPIPPQVMAPPGAAAAPQPVDDSSSSSSDSSSSSSSSSDEGGDGGGGGRKGRGKLGKEARQAQRQAREARRRERMAEKARRQHEQAARKDEDRQRQREERLRRKEEKRRQKEAQRARKNEHRRQHAKHSADGAGGGKWEALGKAPPLYQIHAAVGGKVVVGVTAGGECYLNVKGGKGEWTRLDGVFKQAVVAPRASEIWGVTRNDEVFCRSGKDGRWELVPGPMSQIQMDGRRLVGVNAANQAFWRDGRAGEWIPLDGLLKHISCGKHGRVITGVDAMGNGFVRQGRGAPWQPVPGCFRQLDVTPDGSGFVAVTPANQAFYMRNAPSGEWVQLEGAFTAVGSSKRAVLIYGCAPDGKVFRQRIR